MYEITIKLLWAFFLAGILGLEREHKGRSAGLRTHILVCVGSTLSIIVADVIAKQTAASGVTVWVDKGRIAAGILTGVGFLGAGAIINTGNVHRGLTTAALIWFVAALGIAIGAGLFYESALATAFVLVIVVGLRYVEYILPTSERCRLEFKVHGSIGILEEIEHLLRKQGYRVSASSIRTFEDNDCIDIAVDLVAPRRVNIEALASLLKERYASATNIAFER